MLLAYAYASGKLISALKGKHQPGSELSARAIRYRVAKDFQGTGKGRREYVALEAESLLRFSASVITAWNELGRVDFSDIFNASQEKPFYYRRHDLEIYAALAGSGFNPAQIACAVNKLLPMNLETPRGATSNVNLQWKAAKRLKSDAFDGLRQSGYSEADIQAIRNSPDARKILGVLGDNIRGLDQRKLKGTPICRIPFSCVARITKQMAYKWSKSPQYRAQFQKCCRLIEYLLNSPAPMEPHEAECPASTAPLENAAFDRFMKLKRLKARSSPPRSSAAPAQ